MPTVRVKQDPELRPVFSALNIEDSRELFTLARIEPADIPAWMAGITPVEERRYERIKHLVGEPTLNAVYQVSISPSRLRTDPQRGTTIGGPKSADRRCCRIVQRDSISRTATMLSRRS